MVYLGLEKGWIGGYAETDGTKLKPFQWKYGDVAGTDISTVYEDWCGEEPEDSSNEQCLGIDDPTKTNGATGTEICWSNRNCERTRNPVCQYCES